VNADCPFGTQCQLGSLFPGVSLCTRVCFADMDCQSGFVCKYTTSGTEKICQLK
jgi:Cys-rich repeat protein